ncbi:MAG: UDP-2,3-diacylglucosamine diphosphatase [Candidatus Pacebacteria bacterium]|jgi:UDP-2,3-diacylglucosamine pyrophosphatase LpxH|nr:UDP-2,3-diacylglucosamine diphosphatase [Candidatus Paceibacterota bacterium]
MKSLIHLRDEPGVSYWRFVDNDSGELNQAPPKEGRRTVHSLIISDLHFGTAACRARALLAMLNTFWIEGHLILLGDIFHDLEFKRISGAQWKVISRIRKLTDPDLPLTEVWIRGNHDNATIDIFRYFIGIEVLNEFIWECGGKRYLAIHGDQFDHFVNDRPLMTKIIVALHSIVQILDPHHRHIESWLARKSGEWRRESAMVALGALKYGREKNVDVIFCGHTHEALRQRETDIEYINTGCWVKNLCSFVTITEDGPILNFVELP